MNKQPDVDPVDLALLESFPASDPPAWAGFPRPATPSDAARQMQGTGDA